MAYGDGKYQSVARRPAEGIYVPHSRWREEVRRRGPGACYEHFYSAEAQARARSHTLGLPVAQMLAWQNDPANIAKFTDLAYIAWPVRQKGHK